VAYLSPEARPAAGQIVLDFTKSDVWAMGINLLHMMSSHHDDDPLTDLLSIPFIDCHYSIELRTLVRSMLSVHPANRPNIIHTQQQIHRLRAR
jgi:serine/threonine protein kinase